MISAVPLLNAPAPAMGNTWYEKQVWHDHDNNPMTPVPRFQSRTFHVTLKENRRLVVTICNKQTFFDIPSICIRLLIVFMSWFILWLLARNNTAVMEPGGMLFDPIFCVLVSGVVGSHLARILFLPPLLGILVVGLIMGAMPGNITAGITGVVAGAAQDVAVAIIVLRAGFGLNLNALRKVSGNAAILSLLPAAGEAVVYGYMCDPLFGMDFVWGSLMGFAVNAAGPSIVVPIMIPLQNEGYGHKRGVGSLIMASSALNVVFSIAGHGVLMSLAFNDGDPVLAAAMVPVQIVVGLICGVFIAYAVLWLMDLLFSEDKDNKLPTDPNQIKLKCSILTLAMSLCCSLGFSRYQLNGAGVLANMAFGATLAHLLGEKGKTDPYSKARKAYIATFLGDVWNLVAQPVLYALVGAQVNVKSLFNADLVPKGLSVLVAGTVARMVLASICSLGVGLTWRDIAFIALCWSPKATVQAALSGRAFVKAVDLLGRIPSADDVPLYESRVLWGEEILSVTILGVLVFATIGGILIQSLAKKLLEQEDSSAPAPVEVKATAGTTSGTAPQTPNIAGPTVIANIRDNSKQPLFSEDDHSGPLRSESTVFGTEVDDEEEEGDRMNPFALRHAVETRPFGETLRGSFFMKREMEERSTPTVNSAGSTQVRNTSFRDAQPPPVAPPVPPPVLATTSTTDVVPLRRKSTSPPTDVPKSGSQEKSTTDQQNASPTVISALSDVFGIPSIQQKLTHLTPGSESLSSEGAPPEHKNVVLTAISDVVQKVRHAGSRPHTPPPASEKTPQATTLDPTDPASPPPKHNVMDALGDVFGFTNVHNMLHQRRNSPPVDTTNDGGAVVPSGRIVEGEGNTTVSTITASPHSEARPPMTSGLSPSPETKQDVVAIFETSPPQEQRTTPPPSTNEM